MPVFRAAASEPAVRRPIIRGIALVISFGAGLFSWRAFQAIRTRPLGRGLRIEVKKQAALRVPTAAQPAELVLVEIIDVGGSGTAGLRATSWQVPN